MEPEKTLKRKWSAAETRLFLQLCAENHIIKMMDGKRLRMKQVFGTLVPLMAEKGFQRDADQLLIKWKNLKREYYKCRRHNSVSGNDPKTFEFYEILDELLNTRPASQLSGGYESNQETIVTLSSEEEVVQTLSPVPNCIVEYYAEDYDNLPDSDDATPGPSTSPSLSSCPESTSGSTSSISSHSTKRNTTKPTSANKRTKLSTVYDDMKTLLSEVAKTDNNEEVFLQQFFEKQEKMLKAFSLTMLKGMREFFKKNKNVKNDSSEDSSDSSD